jgi:hypothetical protein
LRDAVNSGALAKEVDMKRKMLLLILILSSFALACNLANETLIGAAPETNAVTAQAEMPELTMTPPADVATGQTPPPSALQADDDPLALINWNEPSVDAFATSIPAGWLAEGGMSASYGMLHPWMQVASPDGNIVIRYGYGQLPLYILPHSVMAEAGYPEGALVSMDGGLTTAVKRYQTGEQAAEATARTDLQQFCQDLSIDERRNLGTYTSEGIEISEGSVDFHCLVQEQRLVGRYTATTRKVLASQDGAGVWLSDKIAGYAALDTRAGQAEHALSVLSNDLSFNRSWSDGYQEVAELPGLYFDVADQSGGSTSPFFEDQMSEFCIRNGC